MLKMALMFQEGQKLLQLQQKQKLQQPQQIQNLPKRKRNVLGGNSGAKKNEKNKLLLKSIHQFDNQYMILLAKIILQLSIAKHVVNIFRGDKIISQLT